MTSMRLPAIASSAFLLMYAGGAAAKTCSIAKTNHSCTLTIDREYPVSPPTIQMYSGSTLTVTVKNPLPFENYTLDTIPGTAAQNPDAYAAFLQGQGLLSSLPTLALATHAHNALLRVAPAAVPPKPCTTARGILTNAITLYNGMISPKPGQSAVPANQVKAAFANAKTSLGFCAQSLLTDARKAYADIDPYLNRYLSTYTQEPTRPLLTPFSTIKADIDAYTHRETKLSSLISTIPSGVPGSSVGPDVAGVLFQFTSDQKLLDGIASDLFGYEERFSDFVGNLAYGWQHDRDLCLILWPAPPPRDPATGNPADSASYCPTQPATDAISLVASQDNSAVYENMAIRSKIYTLNALNMVANQAQSTTVTSTNKLAIASVTVQYAGDSQGLTHYSSLRWDASLGVLVSMIPIRSFSVQPVYTGTTVTNNLVHETTTSPQWVPFAAANYRIADHLPWKTRWQSGIYVTFALGVNPNTKTADGAAGFSLAWRELMFSLLCHFTHDTRLTSGFYNNQSLGPTFTGTLPTETYWRKTFALGISVRVPTVTGR